MPGPLPTKRKAPFKWSESEIASAVLVYLNWLDVDAWPTLAGYDAFRREHAPHLPSLPALKDRGAKSNFQQTSEELLARSSGEGGSPPGHQ
jgi:hypothetical protein